MKNQNVREIDKLAHEVHSWWGRTFVFIKKTQVKTWQGVFILAFVAGVVAAIVWTVSLNIQTSSDAAAGKASLKISPDNYVALIGEVFDINILLNTGGNSVVVGKATLVYNPQDFELQKWDTSQSVFSQNNPCQLDNKPCEIIYDDKSAGKITFILPRPTPGVKTASGLVARLTFKALREVTTGNQNFKLHFLAEGNYTDSDVILDDGQGTDVLGSVGNATITALNAVCTDFTYSEWGACQPDGMQTRTLVSSLPASCKGGNPVLTQSCGQERDQICAQFQYSEWGPCDVNNTQSRTVVSAVPLGCTGGNPVLTQSCQARGEEPQTCASFQYSEWGPCGADNTQSRTVASSVPPGCVGGDPLLTQSCQYSAPVCTDFTYSDWGVCHSNSKQSRTVLTSTPAGCQGGSPLLEQVCVFQSKLDRNLVIRYSPKKVKHGATLTQSGSKFSSSNQVTVYMYLKKRSKRSFLPAQSVNTDASGNFSLTLQAPLLKGKYYWYVIDEATGKRSKLGRLRVR